MRNWGCFESWKAWFAFAPPRGIWSTICRAIHSAWGGAEGREHGTNRLGFDSTVGLAKRYLVTESAVKRRQGRRFTQGSQTTKPMRMRMRMRMRGFLQSPPGHRQGRRFTIIDMEDDLQSRNPHKALPPPLSTMPNTCLRNENPRLHNHQSQSTGKRKQSPTNDRSRGTHAGRCLTRANGPASTRSATIRCC